MTKNKILKKKKHHHHYDYFDLNMDCHSPKSSFYQRVFQRLEERNEKEKKEKKLVSHFQKRFLI